MSNYKSKTKTTTQGKSGRNATRNPNPANKYKGLRKGKRDNSESYSVETPTNDPMWYATDPSLLRDSASIPFSWAVGTPIDLANPAFEEAGVEQGFTIPGLCALRVVPTAGRADDAADPINVAAFRMYSFVRHLNSGSKNYDAPDLMLYMLAMSQVYSYINFLQRAYGLATAYAQKNRYMPNSILKSMGLDPEDIRNNLASLRYGINVLINEAASLCVPATMTIFARHAMLYQNIYVGGASIKNQLYYYFPDGFWKYTLNTSGDDYSGMLEYDQFYYPEVYRGVDSLLAYGKNMIARLVQSEDMNIMSGDIKKAYGENNLIKLTPLTVDYMVIPVYDEMVLTQIKNSTVCPVTRNTLNVVQDETKAHLMFHPQYVYQGNANYGNRAVSQLLKSYAEKRILSLNNVDPQPTDIMEATRLMNIPLNIVRDADNVKTIVWYNPGSEMVIGVHYCWLECDTTFQIIERGLHQYELQYLTSYDVDLEDEAARVMKISSILSHFKYRPCHRFAPYRQSSSDPEAFNLVDVFINFDVDNYAIIDKSMLDRMHESALLSMLNVPSVVKI